MEGREPVIGVYLSRNGEYYVVEVVDNGPGMEREVAEKAFEPFFSTYDVDDGHGLGLSSCLGIVNSLGGTIEIASRLEKGTTVTVTLPVAVGATNDADHPDGVEEPQEPIVYVVDDEPLVGRAIKRTLGTGYSLEFFTDADAALRALENGGSPAAIICDIMMPGKTGVDLFRVVEANHPGLVDAFVFLSGGVFSESMETRLKAIKAPRVTKPFSPDHLRETVCQIVSRT